MKTRDGEGGLILACSDRLLFRVHVGGKGTP